MEHRLYIADISLQVLIIACIILVPFAFMPQGSIIVEAEISFVEAPKVFIFRVLVSLMLVPLFLKLWYREFKLNPISITILFFFLWIGISTLFSKSILISTFGEFAGQDSYSLLTNVFYLIVFLATATTFNTERKVRRLLLYIGISGTIVSLPIIWQTFNLNIFDFMPPRVGRPSGTFGNPVFAASFLNLTIATTLILAFRNPKIALPLLLIQVIAILATESRGAIFGVFIMVIIWLAILGIRQPKIALVATSICAAIIVIFVLTTSGLDRFKNAPNDIETRATYWKTSLKVSKDYPLTGVGPDMFRYFHLQYGPTTIQGIPEEPDHAHNWILHYTVETGIIGGIASGLLIGVPILYANPMYTPLLVSRLVDQSLGVSRISDIMLFFILLGVMYEKSINFVNITNLRNSFSFIDRLQHNKVLSGNLRRKGT